METEEKIISGKFSELPHKIRSYHRCWCDQEASAGVMRGLLLPCYVIEVEVVARSEETSDSLVHVVQSLEGGVKLQNKQKATNKIAEHASKVK